MRNSSLRNYLFGKHQFSAAAAAYLSVCQQVAFADPNDAS
jgi:hypothetical protein